MRFKLIIVAVAIVMVGGTYAFFSRAPSITNYPPKGKDIVAFGDSLVVGAGSTMGNDFVSLLSKKAGQPIVNLGHSGDTTADGLARINELDAYDPKVVLLLLGGNDHLKKLPREATRKNLATLIENIQSRGAVVLLLGVRGGLFNDRFDAEFEALRDTYHTAFVSDVLDGLLGNPQYMSDTIHPNDMGYKMIAERIYPKLIEIIE